MALKGAKSQLQQEMTYGGVASSRIRPLTRLVGKFSKSKVVPKKKIRVERPTGSWVAGGVVGWQVERPAGGWVVDGEAHRWLGGRWRGPQVVGW